MSEFFGSLAVNFCYLAVNFRYLAVRIRRKNIKIVQDIHSGCKEKAVKIGFFLIFPLINFTI
jgi:hypothetical protein